MNRRQFIKSLSGVTAGLVVLPSVKATPSPSPPSILKIFNGQVFQAPYPLCHTVIVMYFGRGDQWVLLSAPYGAAQHNGTAMVPCYYMRKDGSDNPFYTQVELQEKLKDWKLVVSNLILSFGGSKYAPL